MSQNCVWTALKIITYKPERILKECQTKLHVNPAHHILNNKIFIMLWSGALYSKIIAVALLFYHVVQRRSCQLDIYDYTENKTSHPD